MFGKKKTEDVRSGLQSADISPNKQAKQEKRELEPELTEMQKSLMIMAEELKEEYGSYLTPVDAANVSLPVLQSEMIVLLAGIYGELKKMNMTLHAINQQGQ